MLALLVYFFVAFAVTWTCWIAVITIPLRGALGSGVILAGVFAPSFAGIIVTTWTEGSAQTIVLLSQIFRWRVAPGWYLLAVSYMASVKLLAAVVHRLLTGAWPTFGHMPLPLIIIIISTPFQSGEEIGWRGYALPRLAEHIGVAPASVLLGAIWACWHLPQFFIPGDDTSGQSFFIWSIQVIAVSIAMAWVFVGTKGNLLLAMIMHSAINQSSGIVSAAIPRSKRRVHIARLANGLHHYNHLVDRRRVLFSADEKGKPRCKADVTVLPAYSPARSNAITSSREANRQLTSLEAVRWVQFPVSPFF
jgi:membrane protease YdiL (CAAX protease family)